MTSGREFYKLALRIGIVVGLYIIFGYIGHIIAAPPEYATLIWPPAGIALGALLIWDRRLWMGVALAAIIFNTSHIFIDAKETHDYLPIFLSGLGIAFGSTVQAVVGFKLISRYVGKPSELKTFYQTLIMFILGGPVACIISATVGTTVLWANGYLVGSDILSNWFMWWTGDVFGVCVFLPLMLMLPVGEGGRLFKSGASKSLPSLAIFAVILPLGLTFYAWKLSSEYIYEKNKAYFEIMVREAQRSLVNRLEAYQQNLASSSSYLMEKDFIVRQEWDEYVDSLRLQEYNPGINGLGVILDVPSAELDHFLALQKKDIPSFNIHPVLSENYIITYIEPLKGNEPALGFNIASEAKRREAAINSRDTGNTTITKILTLVQDKSKGAGFLILHPIYERPIATLKTVQERRAHFKGWIYAPFIGKNFMESLSLLQSHMLDLKAYDGLEVKDDNLIFNTLDHNRDHAARSPFFVVKTPIHVLEEDWTLVWLSTHEFEESVDSNEPAIILISGLIVSFLMGLILLTMSKRAENIESLVAEKTKELSASEEKFREVMEFASIGKAIVALDGRFLKVNHSLCEFLGYSEEELMS